MEIARALPFPSRDGSDAQRRASSAAAPVMTRRPARPIDSALPREAVAPWALTAWRLAAAIALVAPFALAPDVAPGTDPDWVRLVRGTALTKLALAVPIVLAADWRVQRAGPCAIRVGWVAAALLAAVGPGSIWGLRSIGAASIAFHAALSAAVALLFVDGGRVGRAMQPAGRGDPMR